MYLLIISSSIRGNRGIRNSIHLHTYTDVRTLGPGGGIYIYMYVLSVNSYIVSSKRE